MNFANIILYFFHALCYVPSKIKFELQLAILTKNIALIIEEK
jgi:hypothetical protein